MPILLKYLLTAAIVVAASELARRNDRAGALFAALPLVTLLTLVWLQLGNLPAERISNHARYTFWYVIPTLPMFLAFPLAHARFGFWPALGIYATGTLATFFLFALVARRFGLELL